MRFTFSKHERLCRQKQIDALLQRGNPSLLYYPFLLTWKEDKFDPGVPAQVLILASKKNFKRAVDRNRIKRLTREAYRLNKPAFYESLGRHQLILSINYIAKEEIPIAHLLKKMDEALQKIGSGFKEI
jgi:ribonuclease P protein component